jgi:hypothetical protein
MSAAISEGPPAKKARPSSVEDVVLSKAAPGQGTTAGAKSNRGMLTLEEVRCCSTPYQQTAGCCQEHSSCPVPLLDCCSV